MLKVHELVGERAPPLGLCHAGVEPDQVRAIRGGRGGRMRAEPHDDDVAQRAQRPPGVEHAGILAVTADTLDQAAFLTSRSRNEISGLLFTRGPMPICTFESRTWSGLSVDWTSSRTSGMADT